MYLRWKVEGFRENQRGTKSRPETVIGINENTERRRLQAHGSLGPALERIDLGTKRVSNLS